MCCVRSPACATQSADGCCRFIYMGRAPMRIAFLMNFVGAVAWDNGDVGLKKDCHNCAGSTLSPACEFAATRRKTLSSR